MSQCKPFLRHRLGLFPVPPGSPHVRRFPRVTFAREGPAVDLTLCEEFVEEAFTLSHQVTEALDAPNQQTTLLQGVEQALTPHHQPPPTRLASPQPNSPTPHPHHLCLPA